MKHTFCKKEIKIFEDSGVELKEDKLYRGLGCKVCNFTGYKGRTGIHELFSVDETAKSLIIEQVSTEEMKRYALGHNMKTLRQDGLLTVN